MHYKNDAAKKINDTITETYDRLYEKIIFLLRG